MKTFTKKQTVLLVAGLCVLIATVVYRYASLPEPQVVCRADELSPQQTALRCVVFGVDPKMTSFQSDQSEVAVTTKPVSPCSQAVFVEALAEKSTNYKLISVNAKSVPELGLRDGMSTSKSTGIFQKDFLGNRQEDGLPIGARLESLHILNRDGFVIAEKEC